MFQQIETRKLAKANAIVERIYQNDTISETLAAFEYSFMADDFAKLLSRQSKDENCAYVVRRAGANYADCAFVSGKKVKGEHWAEKVKWSINAK